MMQLQALVERFKKVAVASVADAVEEVCGRRGSMASAIKPRIGQPRICSPAPADAFVPPQQSLGGIYEAPRGNVVVLSIMGGDSELAVRDGRMTAGAVASGRADAVLDGSVRDLVEIRRDDGFAVYARSASPGTTLGRDRSVASKLPLQVGGIVLHLGDIVGGDVDGVVVVPLAQAEQVPVTAEETDARELEKARLVIAEKSLRVGLAKHGRI